MSTIETSNTPTNQKKIVVSIQTRDALHTVNSLGIESIHGRDTRASQRERKILIEQSNRKSIETTGLDVVGKGFDERSLRDLNSAE